MTSHDAPLLRITWIRTATLLVELGDFRILTDPWFGRVMRVLPVFARPGIPRDRLPPLDLLLVSHLHADHYSVADARALAARQPGLAAIGCPGARPAFERSGLGRSDGGGGALHELAPGESLRVGPAEITAFRCRHTGPPPDEVNYLVRWEGTTVFFGGDARLSDALDDVAAAAAPVDVALLPIGGTLIFGTRTTMDPADALEAARRIGARHVVPTHEGLEWMPVPPASWHPGRTRHFAALCERAVRLRRGERATFTGRGAALALRDVAPHPDGILA